MACPDMPRYLVVDDSATIRKVLGTAIKRAAPGADIVEAEDAQVALARFFEREFDAVFLDMMLAAGRGGLDVLIAILRHRPDANVIVTTGLPNDHPDVVAAVSMGAFARLEKPIRSEAVRGVLAQIDVEEGRVGRIR